MTIDKNGCLSLIKPLDRDPPNGYATWQVIIQASDEGGGPKSLQKTTEVIIILEDINDNAPYLDMVSYLITYITKLFFSCSLIHRDSLLVVSFSLVVPPFNKWIT